MPLTFVDDKQRNRAEYKSKKHLKTCALVTALYLTETMAKTQEEITKNMLSNKIKDTKPELILCKELWECRLCYRKNYKKVVGKPYIAFVGKR